MATRPKLTPISFLQPLAWREPSEGQSSFLVPQIASPASAAERWASYVLGACRSAKDLKTIGIWARQVAVSYTTLCESCRLIEVQPRYARDFTRVLRIILMPTFDFSQLTTYLDISDRRTLHAILQKAGFEYPVRLPGLFPVVSFLEHQKFIAEQNPGVKIIRDIFAAL
ncbi:MAG: hypothetical protein WA672_20225 [Candidatus Angelobacter sp.]